MARHLLAYTSNVGNVTDVELNVVEDSVITRSGPTRYVVPAGLNIIDYVTALAPNLIRSRIFTASAERNRTQLFIIPHFRSGNTLSSSGQKVSTYLRGVSLDPTEDISIKVTDNIATGTEDVYAFVQLSDGKASEIPNGPIRIVRCTSNTTLTAKKWSLVNITPDVQLEAGQYALVGFLPWSAGILAARVVLTGQVNRGGVIAPTTATEAAMLEVSEEYYAYLEPYNYGIFDHRSLPQFEFFSITADTSEVVYLKILKIG